MTLLPRFSAKRPLLLALLAISLPGLGGISLAQVGDSLPEPTGAPVAVPSISAPTPAAPAMESHQAPTGQPSLADTALKIETSSRKVPMGTMLKVVFNTSMDSRITTLGEPFSAYLAEDFTNEAKGVRQVILPAGTFVRGRIEQVRRPGLFSRGGSIALNFDHVVLPSGELMPLDLKLSTTNETVNKKGSLYSDPGIGKKVEKGFQDGVKTFNSILDKGVQAGKGMGDGLGQLVTVPVAAAGGVLAGGAITTGKTAVAVVGKGESVIIEPGDSVTIDFGGSFTLPSE